MEAISNYPDTDFAVLFLTRLRKIFCNLHPLEIREREREGIHYFNAKFFKICLYNAYPEGVQLVFNRHMLTEHFGNAYDFPANAPADWRLIITLITDIAEKIIISER